jgi:large subunit ribosomal protein L31
MKKDIHPKYYAQAIATCSCGAVFEVGSTREKISIETCSQCHPIYTGKQKIVDATGRVDRFKKLAEKTQKAKESRKMAKKATVKKVAKSKKKIKTAA